MGRGIDYLGEIGECQDGLDGTGQRVYRQVFEQASKSAQGPDSLNTSFDRLGMLDYLPRAAAESQPRARAESRKGGLESSRSSMGLYLPLPFVCARTEGGNVRRTARDKTGLGRRGLYWKGNRQFCPTQTILKIYDFVCVCVCLCLCEIWMYELCLLPWQFVFFVNPHQHSNAVCRRMPGESTALLIFWRRQQAGGDDDEQPFPS